MAYNTLSRAQLSFDYLHTNSTTHEFLFGALAELLDNARDASATKINIYTTTDKTMRGGFTLCFLDDGEGMDPNETTDIVTFGKSTKRSVEMQHIGMYGNGLKSGSMRIGNDLILFTKKGLTMSCLFLSRTFHEEENIDEVIVPLPSFEASTRRPLTKGTRAQERHDTEMNLIFKYSPFHTEEEFFAQFDRIEGNSGTLVVIFNIKLMDDGNTELDVISDPHDILLAKTPEPDFDGDDGLMPERKSFRAYASILYMDPRMRIYIQGKKVHTKRLASCLYKPKLYKYSSNRFKTRTESEAKRAQDEALAADNKAREAESKAKNLECKYGAAINKDQRADLRKAQTTAAEFRREADLKRQLVERKAKALKDPKTLNLIFGVNLENRGHDGVFVYNCSRLIKMYEKVGPQTEGGVYCSGVVGIVDVPYLVLEPTHNKQDFADAKEYRHLMRAMGEHMVQYWKDVGIAQQGITKFCSDLAGSGYYSRESYGYISSGWRDPPSDDIKFVRKRAMQINKTLQCDLCLKWRTLPFQSSSVSKDFPDNWQCNMNPDQQHNRCSTAEQKLNIPEGFIKKEGRTQEQKKKDLEEEIKKKQEQLEKMQKTRVVLSHKDIPEMPRKVSPPPPPTHPSFKIARRRQSSPSPPRRQQPSPPLPAPRSRSTSSPVQKPKPSPTPSRTTVPPPLKSAPTSKTASKPVHKVEPKYTPAPSPRIAQSRERTPALKMNNKKEEVRKLHPSPQTVSVGRKRSATEENSVTVQSKRTGKSVSVQMSDSEEDEEEEEEAEAVASKKSKVLLTPAATNVPAAVKELITDQPRIKPPPGVFESTEEDNEASQSGMEAMDVDMSNVEGEVVVNDADSNGDIGTRVEALINNKWHTGVVVHINPAEAKWKVKFDLYPKDKYDKWYEKNSSDIRIHKNDTSNDAATMPAPTSVESQTQETLEAPTSSTASMGNTASSTQYTDEIANGYRTCLRYFLPPQWIMDKEAISAMNLQELSDFPLDDFFDHYERGLRRLVSNFQTEATMRRQEADTAKSKLASVRKLIAKLLKSTNEEFDIDPEADGDQVDELLSMCVRQAVQSQT